MTVVAHLRTGYNKRRLFGDKLALDAPGTLVDGPGLACVVAQATKQQRVNNRTTQVVRRFLLHWESYSCYGSAVPNVLLQQDRLGQVWTNIDGKTYPL